LKDDYSSAFQCAVIILYTKINVEDVIDPGSAQTVKAIPTINFYAFLVQKILYAIQ
jgi:hypothetical protein